MRRAPLSTRPPAGRDMERPVMRRDNRSSGAYAAAAADGGMSPRRSNSFQMQLQRLSMHSDNSFQLQPLVDNRPRLPVINATPDSDVVVGGLAEAAAAESTPPEMDSLRSRITIPVHGPDQNTDPASGLFRFLDVD